MSLRNITAAVAICATAATELLAQIANFPTRLVVNGQSFSQVSYVSHDASRLKINHAHGIANLPIEDLPSFLQEKLGYEPVAAAANERLLAERNANARKTLQERYDAIENKKAAERSREAEKLRNTPTIISPEDVKKYWLRASGSLVPQNEFHYYYAQRLKEHRAFVQEIASGYWDYAAIKVALEWNVEEYRRVGNETLAAKAQQDLDAFLAEMAQRQEAAEREKHTRLLEGINARIGSLNSEVRNLSWRLQNGF